MTHKAQATHNLQGNEQNRWFVLIILTLVYVFNFIDRQIIGILAPFIAADLNLKDGQIGLLGGIYFAAFYTLIAIPIAWLADRSHRVTIIAVSLGIWSAFTAASGLAQNFVQLSLARMGVGVGEAGGSPPSHAIISDLFRPNERSRALAIYSLGIPLGITIAYFAVAYLLANQGDVPFDWRQIFFGVGLLGIGFAVVVRLVVREPERGAMDQQAESAKGRKIGLLDAIQHLVRIKSWVGMCLGISMASFGGYALSTFLVKYLVQNFPGTSMPQLYVWLGLINGLVYTAGIFFGGALCDHFGKRNRGAYASIPALSILVAAPIMIFGLWSPHIGVAIFCVAAYLFLAGFYLGPSFSIAQTLAPIEMRAMSTALFFFILNMIAMGGGPTITGFLSDWFAANIYTQPGGETLALRAALTCLIIPYGFSVLFFWFTSRHLAADWVQAEAHNRGE